MNEASTPDRHGDETASAETPTTVEAVVRTRLMEVLGGARGAAEAAVPIIVFTLVFTVTEEIRTAAVVALGIAAALFGIRMLQKKSTEFVRNGLFGIAIAMVLATTTGRAEAAFLPGIFQNAAGALVLGASIIVRRPVMGYVIGGLLGSTTTWRDHPAILRLSTQLTAVLLVPLLIRPAVQYPLYLAGDVGWLGVTRVTMGWPLSLLAVAVAGAILARGNTPMEHPPAR